MNLILLTSEDRIESGEVTLDGYRADHIHTILKAKAGDTLRVGLVNGPVGKAVIQEITGRLVRLRLFLEDHLPERPRIDLLLALPRPIMLKKVLFHAASLGCGRIFLVNAGQVEKSYFHSSLLREHAYYTYLYQGLEQAVHTYLPEVFIFTRFRVFVEDELPFLAVDCPIRLLAHPETNENLWEVMPLTLEDERILLAVGPEGGWNAFEVKALIGRGFRSFSMGSRILRVETAVAALFGQINLLCMREKLPNKDNGNYL